MSESGSSDAPCRLAKLIGGVTMVLGGALVVMAFYPVKQIFSGENEWMDYLIALIGVSVMAVPGSLMILGGYQFLREVNLPNLKVLVGVYSALGALWIASKLSDVFPELWHQRIAAGSFMLGEVVFGILIYLLALRWLVPALGMKWNGVRSVLGKGIFTLLAWLLWQTLFAVAQEGFPATGWGGLHTGLFVLLGPLSVAWGFHFLAVKWLKAGSQTIRSTQ